VVEKLTGHGARKSQISWPAFPNIGSSIADPFENKVFGAVKHFPKGKQTLWRVKSSET